MVTSVAQRSLSQRRRVTVVVPIGRTVGVRGTRWRRWTEETLIHTSSDPGSDSPRIVLRPKLRAPLPRPEQLVRRRLLEILRNALDFKVTIVSAPTGYGKTTLLA